MIRLISWLQRLASVHSLSLHAVSGMTFPPMSLPHHPCQLSRNSKCFATPPCEIFMSELTRQRNFGELRFGRCIPRYSRLCSYWQYNASFLTYNRPKNTAICRWRCLPGPSGAVHRWGSNPSPRSQIYTDSLQLSYAFLYAGLLPSFISPYPPPQKKNRICTNPMTQHVPTRAYL